MLPTSKPSTQETDIDWSNFKTMIDAAESILLISHIRPDGDAIGSQIALHRALAVYGKRVFSINANPLPPNLVFLDEDHVLGDLQNLSDDLRREMENVDLIICLDTSSWAQLGTMSDVIRASHAAKLVIDHHAKGDDIGAVRFVDSHAEAAGALVVKAIDALGLPLEYRYAFPIFVAVATDTGWFRFSSVTAETCRTAAKLIEAGVRVDDVYRILYEQETLGRIRLVGAALAKTEPYLQWRLMFTSLLLDDFNRAGALASESEDIVNMTLTVAGTELAVIMVEQSTGGYKLSFRSRCDLDCSQVAATFGGGGHRKAAGAFIDLPYEEAKRKVLQSLGVEFPE
ncbi:MAG: bifunctional oligoribonuclease/PAP phosphatase NrnA [Thermoguttaceae bacterium]|nr:bifunctional oligoribonuclease/PAP phosphatase NrnA [Thermoguttaceae bacterium]